MRPGDERRDNASARLVTCILLSVSVIAAGVGGAIYLAKSRPETRRRKPPKIGTTVRVETLAPTDRRVVVHAMGTVLPARSISLQARVGGEVVWVSPSLAPGGRLRKGELVLRVDAKDYELVLAQRRGDLARAEYEHTLELGRQEIAREEWARHEKAKSASELDLKLALRKPHLAKAEAALDAAKAVLERARLDLQRTEVRAPFNCAVIKEHVALGAQVTSQTQLAALAGTDAFRVQVSVPVDQLKWLKTVRDDGEEGCSAVVRQTTSAANPSEREGRIVRLLSSLEHEGRMARVLVEVADPLDLEDPDAGRPPLFLGSYVNVAFNGTELRGVFVIPRAAVRDGKQVWLMTADGKLSIRDVETVWRDRNAVFVRDGIKAGDRLVLSNIPAPVDGMPLLTEKQAMAKVTAKAMAEATAEEVTAEEAAAGKGKLPGVGARRKASEK